MTNIFLTIALTLTLNNSTYNITPCKVVASTPTDCLLQQADGNQWYWDSSIPIGKDVIMITNTLNNSDITDDVMLAVLH